MGCLPSRHRQNTPPGQIKLAISRKGLILLAPRIDIISGDVSCVSI